MAEHRERVGARIREARKKKGWSQRELADRLPGPVDGPSVSRWERGRVYPEHYLDALAAALDVDVSFFHLGDPAPPGPTPDLMGALNGSQDRFARLEGQFNQLREDVAASREDVAAALDAIFGVIEKLAPPDDAEDNAANDE